MRNPLQDQLLKAGLVKKNQVAQAVREQTRQRQAKGKTPAAPTPGQIDAQRLQAEKAERDRALAAERNARLREAEQRAQVRQIVQTHQLPRQGEIAYRFSDGDAIKSLLVDAPQRSQLADGTLVIVRHDEGYALLPRAAAVKVRERDESMIVLDHGQPAAPGGGDEDDYYKQFKVPDDLIW